MISGEAWASDELVATHATLADRPSDASASSEETGTPNGCLNPIASPASRFCFVASISTAPTISNIPSPGYETTNAASNRAYPYQDRSN